MYREKNISLKMWVVTPSTVPVSARPVYQSRPSVPPPVRRAGTEPAALASATAPRAATATRWPATAWRVSLGALGRRAPQCALATVPVWPCAPTWRGSATAGRTPLQSLLLVMILYCLIELRRFALKIMCFDPISRWVKISDGIHNHRVKVEIMLICREVL